MSVYRQRCFDVHERRCWACGTADGETEKGRPKIQVHHIDGHNGHHEVENLVPLCVSCHQKVHGNRRSGRIGMLQAEIYRAKSHLPTPSYTGGIRYEDGELVFRANEEP